jgi:hypothetical protein
VCTDDECQPPSCDDDVLNQDETDVDCGGSCDGCPAGDGCKASTDCESLVCDGAACADALCDDDVLNGDETDIDCGGSCGRCGAGENCDEDDECSTGYCEDGTCTYTTSCSSLLAQAPASADGSYAVNPSGSNAFSVYCDMSTAGGGWTRVAYEPSGAAGPQEMGDLARLSQEVAGPNVVANASAAGNIGARFNGLYSQLRLTWGPSFAQMTVGENIFADTVRTSIALTGFSTNDSELQTAVNGAGSAVFCRAHTSSALPGDTSWAVKPSTSTSNTCGCSGMGWAGAGLFYGGAIPNNDTCYAFGGGFVGFAGEGEQKAALSSTEALTFWVR